MRSLVLTGVGQIEFAETRRPAAAPGEVVVDVSLAGICGSDVHGYLGHSDRRSRNLPLVMGHEVVGRVASIGSGTVTNLTIGDRVVVQPMTVCHACRPCRRGLTNLCENMAILGIESQGAFAEQVAFPANQAFGVPDEMSDHLAAMVEPLAIEVRAMRVLAGALPRSVLVLGAGSQGVLAIHLARIMGVPRIIATDTIQHRIDLALNAGATDGLLAGSEDIPKTVMEITDGDGVDLAIETAGAGPARRDGLASLASGGTLALVGLGSADTSFNALDIVASEKRIQGVYCYSDDDFTRAIEILASGAIDVEPLIGVQGLSTGSAAFASIVDGSANAVKTLLDPKS
jgi:2-desacetyl-2-hydroxyethyl bacteriochlorophyllide A dehydrogenase